MLTHGSSIISRYKCQTCNTFSEYRTKNICGTERNKELVKKCIANSDHIYNLFDNNDASKQYLGRTRSNYEKKILHTFLESRKFELIRQRYPIFLGAKFLANMTSNNCSLNQYFGEWDICIEIPSINQTVLIDIDSSIYHHSSQSRLRDRNKLDSNKDLPNITMLRIREQSLSNILEDEPSENMLEASDAFIGQELGLSNSKSTVKINRIITSTLLHALTRHLINTYTELLLSNKHQKNIFLNNVQESHGSLFRKNLVVLTENNRLSPPEIIQNLSKFYEKAFKRK